MRHQLPDHPGSLNLDAFSIPYQLQDGSSDEVLIQPFQSVRPSLEPINSRAWTLQEKSAVPTPLDIWVTTIARMPQWIGSGIWTSAVYTHPDTGGIESTSSLETWFRAAYHTITSADRATTNKSRYFSSYETVTPLLERGGPRLLGTKINKQI